MISLCITSEEVLSVLKFIYVPLNLLLCVDEQEYVDISYVKVLKF